MSSDNTEYGMIHGIDRNDCAVRAVAIASGESYDRVRKLFRRLGRKDGCGTPMYITHKAIDVLGWKTIDVTDDYRSRTLKKITAEIEPHLVFLAITCDHVACIRDGMVYDWAEGSLRRIKRLLRLVPKKRSRRK